MTSTKFYSPNDPWGRYIQQTKLHLNELVKFEVTSRLTGDLGFFVYTSDDFVMTSLTPRFQYTSSSGYVSQFSFQFGDRRQASLAMSKSIGGTSVTIQGEFDEILTPSISLYKSLDKTTDVRVDIKGGNNNSCGFDLTKEYNTKNKLHLSSSISPNKFETYIGWSKSIFSKITTKLAVNFEIDHFTSKHRVFHVYPEFSIGVDLSKSASLAYSIEAEPNRLIFATKINKDGISVKIPIVISKVYTNKLFALCCGVALGASFITHLFSRYFFSKRSLDIKDKLSKSKKERQVKDFEDFIVHIRDSAEYSKRAEISVGGLVILNAYYGDINSGNQSKCIDVTSILQILVVDSQLILPKESKMKISGFYNPNENHEPMLYVKYSISDLVKEVEIEDNDYLVLP